MDDSPKKKDDFTQKKVDQPVFDSDTRQRLGANSANSRTSPFGPAAGVGGRFSEFFRSNKWYFLAIAIGIIIIGVLAFFAFRRPKAVPKPANVAVTIDAPDTVASSAEFIYKVKIENKDPAKLVGMQLEAVYPEGTTFVSSSPDPANGSGTLFPVPDLATGQNATLFLKAKIQGNVNDEKKLTVNLHYHYDYFNSEFIASGDKTVRLTASDVLFEVSGPDQTNNSEVVEYKVHYKNNSDPISSARIQLTYPDGFSFASATPNPDVAKNIWNLGRIDTNQEGTISIQGSYKSAQPGQSATVSAAFLAMDQTGNFFTQAESKFTTNVSAQPLLVTQSVENLAGVEGVVHPGDNLTYRIQYRNNAAVAARNVIVTAVLTSKALNLASIQAQGAQVNNNTITWNASSIANLETLNPSESGTLSFSVEVKNPAVKDTSTNVDIASAVKIKSDEYTAFLPGNDLTLKVATIASISGSVAFASGNLPPKVGTSTTYTVTLSVRNSTNGLTGGALTAFIPAGSGSFDLNSIPPAEKNNVDFTPSSGKLTWRLGGVPPHIGDFKPARSLLFTVKIAPSSAQIGREVVLVKTIAMSAKDSFTGESLTLSADDLTTDSIPGSFGQGQVVE